LQMRCRDKQNNIEWSLHPSVFKAICDRCDRPHVDLFATHLNRQLPTFISPIPHAEAWAVDAMSLDWSQILGYAFPPFAMLTRTVEQILVHSATILLIAPACGSAIAEPDDYIFHQSLLLHAWWLSENHCVTEDSRKESLKESLLPIDNLLEQSTNRDGIIFTLGVANGNQILSFPLVSDFLLHLFRDKSLAISTINGYRAAIAATIEQPHHHVIGHSPELSKLIRNFGLECPRVRSLVPQWNLCFVMDALLRAPFEPMSQTDIKFVTFKNSVF